MKLARRVTQEIKNAQYELAAHTSKLKRRVEHDVPFVCQFARPEHAELSLRGELETVNDPHWKDTGALSPARYADWAFTMCGMASAAMALSHLKGIEKLPAELAEEAMRHGVYADEAGIISGMKYREFVPWIRKYGIKAEVYSRLSLQGIRYALSNGKLVIVSVNPNIRGYDTAPRGQKGGHLILVTGYDLEAGTIHINNPSGFTSTNTQRNHRLSNKEFDRYYAGRGIVLSG
ncbi:MAG: C39 family peptidase [Patescibacteria group bacterium]